jgi:hypothetical protein
MLLDQRIAVYRRLRVAGRQLLLIGSIQRQLASELAARARSNLGREQPLLADREHGVLGATGSDRASHAAAWRNDAGRSDAGQEDSVLQLLDGSAQLKLLSESPMWAITIIPGGAGARKFPSGPRWEPIQKVHRRAPAKPGVHIHNCPLASFVHQARRTVDGQQANCSSPE